MIRIALPNKGSLSEEAATLVKAAGYQVRRDAKELSVLDAANDVDEWIMENTGQDNIGCGNGSSDPQ